MDVNEFTNIGERSHAVSVTYSDRDLANIGHRVVDMVLEQVSRKIAEQFLAEHSAAVLAKVSETVVANIATVHAAQAAAAMTGRILSQVGREKERF